jgi:transposase-like protein
MTSGPVSPAGFLNRLLRTTLSGVADYVPEFEKCWQAYERPVGDSWRVDETYLKVGGQWMYLYRPWCE